MKRVKPRTALTVLTILVIVAATVELSVGPMAIRPQDIVPQTWAYFHGSNNPDAVVMGAIRLPRLCVAALVGAGLASTGAVLQAIFRNPMADPGIIGVSGGGSLGAVVVISSGLAGVNQWFTPLGAFVAGLVAVWLVYRLGTIGGRTTVHALLLSGVAVSAFCSSIVTLLLSIAPLLTMQEMLFWLMGGLDGSSWVHVWTVGAFVLIGLVVYAAQGRALDILSIGDEQAEGVGVHPQRVKRVCLIFAALVVGVCVSVSGVIGFVGLIVPHLVRIWAGPVHRTLIFASALCGAALLLLSDVVARTVVSPSELNIGVVTACLGAPFFMFLLRRQYAAVWRR